MSAARTYVLIAGAWHGGWAWNAVATRLRAQGHTVHTPTMPGLGADDDPRGVTLTDAVTHLIRFFESRDISDATLVAHSWGGFVACGAAPAIAARLRRAVFWSAFVPERGESFLDLLPPASMEKFERQAARSADRTVALSLGAWSGNFMQDAAVETQRVVYELLRPQPFGTFDEPARHDRFAADVPTAFIHSDHDLAMPTGTWGWLRFAERLEGTGMIRLDASHEAMFTRPDDVVAAVLEADAE